jgi:NAD(P)-dependent dehydrogenase (short-subunit alcohol dehydrogenase family)
VGSPCERRFAADGYAVGLVARTAELSQALVAEIGTSARFHRADSSDPGSLAGALAALQRELGEVDVLVYNAGSGVWGNVEEVTPEAFEAAWRVNALGALVASQAVIPSMRRRGQGSIVLVGATASEAPAPGEWRRRLGEGDEPCDAGRRQHAFQTTSTRSRPAAGRVARMDVRGGEFWMRPTASGR